MVSTRQSSHNSESQHGQGSSHNTPNDAATPGTSGGGPRGINCTIEVLALSPGITNRNSSITRYSSYANADKGLYQPATSTLNLLDFPPEILEKIFSYLTYKNVGDMRLVCRRLDLIACSILNSTFQRLQVQMQARCQSIKAQMPRRESARRNHPLAQESDIVETLHMRLTLLQMTFGKHIERKHCSFFAGEILDEVNRILRYIKVNPVLNRAYWVTDELFDLTTMAMEFFKENIEPRLPEITYFGTDLLDLTGFAKNGLSNSQSNFAGASSGGSDLDESVPDSPPPSNMVLRKRIRRIRQGMKRYNTQLAALRRELRTCKGRSTDQNKQLMEYATRLDDYDRKFEESSKKFSTLLQELNKCKTELQYWRSKSPANHGPPLLCHHCGQPVLRQLPDQLQANAVNRDGQAPGEIVHNEDVIAGNGAVPVQFHGANAAPSVQEAPQDVLDDLNKQNPGTSRDSFWELGAAPSPGGASPHCYHGGLSPIHYSQHGSAAIQKHDKMDMSSAEDSAGSSPSHVMMSPLRTRPKRKMTQQLEPQSSKRPVTRGKIKL